MRYLKAVGSLVFISFFQLATAQTNYTKHTLKQGESLSALAKQYNISVGDIMRMNGMHADTKLVYGSVIKIPSTQKQADVAEKSSNEIINTSPLTKQENEITHIVAKGETLYSISKKYNVSLEQLKTWNHLSDDNAKLGTLLIISESGNNKFAAPPVQKQKPENVAAPQPQKEPVIENKPDNTTTNVTDNVANNIQPAMQAVNDISKPVATDNAPSYSGEGFFESQFKQAKSKNLQTVSGISKTFKTASGWSDGKYYILANDIEPGTIVKLTADNGSSVYAKVLWNMGDLKENAGINFRVSNATAAALRENSDSFNINVSF